MGADQRLPMRYRGEIRDLQPARNQRVPGGDVADLVAIDPAQDRGRTRIARPLERGRSLPE